MQKISIVIISFNRAQETVEALRNIFFETDDIEGFEKETILVNNGSSEDYSSVKRFIKEKNLRVDYIESPTNLGVSGGRNLGIAHASGTYTVFIDDDAVFKHKDALRLTHEKFSGDRKLGIIGFGVYNFYTGAADHPIKNRKKREEEESYNTNFYGCGFAVRSDVFKEIGVFDDAFFYGAEEYDLSYRALDKGYDILFTKRIAILHKVSPQGREKNTIKFSRIFVAKCLIAHRYLPRVYVISHAIMWSLYFLVKSRGNLSVYVRSLRRVIELTSKDTTHKISPSTLRYIKSIKGRLLY